MSQRKPQSFQSKFQKNKALSRSSEPIKRFQNKMTTLNQAGRFSMIRVIKQTESSLMKENQAFYHFKYTLEDKADESNTVFFDANSRKFRNRSSGKDQKPKSFKDTYNKITAFKVGQNEKKYTNTKNANSTTRNKQNNLINKGNNNGKRGMNTDNISNRINSIKINEKKVKNSQPIVKQLKKEKEELIGKSNSNRKSQQSQNSNNKNNNLSNNQKNIAKNTQNDLSNQIKQEYIDKNPNINLPNQSVNFNQVTPIKNNQEYSSNKKLYSNKESSNNKSRNDSNNTKIETAQRTEERTLILIPGQTIEKKTMVENFDNPTEELIENPDGTISSILKQTKVTTITENIPVQGSIIMSLEGAPELPIYKQKMTHIYRIITSVNQKPNQNNKNIINENKNNDNNKINDNSDNNKNIINENKNNDNNKGDGIIDDNKNKDKNIINGNNSINDDNKNNEKNIINGSDNIMNDNKNKDNDNNIMNDNKNKDNNNNIINGNKNNDENKNNIINDNKDTDNNIKKNDKNENDGNNSINEVNKKLKEEQNSVNQKANQNNNENNGNINTIINDNKNDDEKNKNNEKIINDNKNGNEKNKNNDNFINGNKISNKNNNINNDNNNDVRKNLNKDKNFGDNNEKNEGKEGKINLGEEKDRNVDSNILTKGFKNQKELEKLLSNINNKGDNISPQEKEKRLNCIKDIFDNIAKEKCSEDNIEKLAQLLANMDEKDRKEILEKLGKDPKNSNLLKNLEKLVEKSVSKSNINKNSEYSYNKGFTSPSEFDSNSKSLKFESVKVKEVSPLKFDGLFLEISKYGKEKVEKNPFEGPSPYIELYKERRSIIKEKLNNLTSGDLEQYAKTDIKQQEKM